jgi:hypothetical protein
MSRISWHMDSRWPSRYLKRTSHKISSLLKNDILRNPWHFSSQEIFSEDIVAHRWNHYYSQGWNPGLVNIYNGIAAKPNSSLFPQFRKSWRQWSNFPRSWDQPIQNWFVTFMSSPNPASLLQDHVSMLCFYFCQYSFTSAFDMFNVVVVPVRKNRHYHSQATD